MRVQTHLARILYLYPLEYNGRLWMDTAWALLIPGFNSIQIRQN